MFQPGETVRVKDDWPEQRGPVHIRTPYYLRGATGRVVRLLGSFPNPEDLAFARPAATKPLYHVRFPRQTLWPEGPPNDEVQVEIYEHWLEKP
ncbi:MAG TPA: SH3-like domain-containing protein [Rhodopila sp.]|uniref:SH3-like domain-containing protein n=1 Tax=Rhodopila sp. TaxID=2480087 RepID=UPI002BC9BFBC|nr:SH3-like domain-containing protein [Rhodopila sp.]HVY17309.1 SH3-like domain-containing protein [Rhodopila sp.]